MLCVTTNFAESIAYIYSPLSKYNIIGVNLLKNNWYTLPGLVECHITIIIGLDSIAMVTRCTRTSVTLLNYFKALMTQNV